MTHPLGIVVHPGLGRAAFDHREQAGGGFGRVLKIDLTPLWHRETVLVGASTYGTDEWIDGSTHTSFSRAIELAGAVDIGALVSAKYPLHRYKDAIRHAAEAGSRGGVKVVFEFREGEKNLDFLLRPFQRERDAQKSWRETILRRYRLRQNRCDSTPVPG